VGGEGAVPFGATAVECDDRIALAGAIHDDEVVRFVGREAERSRRSFRRKAVDTKVGHENELAKC
jgi:hypothetical protein